MSRSFRACCVFAAIAYAPCAFGLANRVFVSARSGNNANSCDNIATPCQSFAGAVLQLNPGGEAIVLDSGGYGPVTITQSLTIAAPPGVLAFIHPPSGHAITITATTATVVLRGLTLDGAGTSLYGIDWTGSGSLHIENCVISGFAWGGIQISPTADSRLFLNDTIVRGAPGTGSNGVTIWPAVNAGNLDVSIDRCRIESNDADGIEIVGESGTSVDAVVRESVLAFNGGGLFASPNSNGSVRVLADRCSAFGSNTGMSVENPDNAVLRVMRSSVTQNSFGLTAYLGAVIETIGNNMVRGNGTDEATDGGATITILPGD